MRTSVIELFKEEMKFSAGHFTIFGAGKRENLHGHNFVVSLDIEGEVVDGMMADYGAYKRAVMELCKRWDETFLLPQASPHLQLRHDGTHVHCRFADEDFSFLMRDVTLLPVANVTLEELSRLLGEALVADGQQLKRDRIHGVVVKCASGPGQWSSWRWRGANLATH
jgi:6-pyruvoyltetrahydropterin/6-carboxytetrahydropterin synthase